MIKIQFDFTDKKKFGRLIEHIQKTASMRITDNTFYFEAQNKMMDLAEETVFNMRKIIQENKVRRTSGNNLEKTIEAIPLNTTGGVEIGIGDIQKLNTDAPYWRVIDIGGYVPYSNTAGAPLGSFEGDRPQTGIVSGNQNWERSGEKGFFMKPKSPIVGIDYIGRSLRQLNRDLKNYLKSIGEDFIESLPK